MAIIGEISKKRRSSTFRRSSCAWLIIFSPLDTQNMLKLYSRLEILHVLLKWVHSPIGTWQVCAQVIFFDSFNRYEGNISCRLSIDCIDDQSCGWVLADQLNFIFPKTYIANKISI